MTPDRAEKRVRRRILRLAFSVAVFVFAFSLHYVLSLGTGSSNLPNTERTGEVKAPERTVELSNDERAGVKQIKQKVVVRTRDVPLWQNAGGSDTADLKRPDQPKKRYVFVDGSGQTLTYDSMEQALQAFAERYSTTVDKAPLAFLVDKNLTEIEALISLSESQRERIRGMLEVEFEHTLALVDSEKSIDELGLKTGAGNESLESILEPEQYQEYLQKKEERAQAQAREVRQRKLNRFTEQLNLSAQQQQQVAAKLETIDQLLAGQHTFEEMNVSSLDAHFSFQNYVEHTMQTHHTYTGALLAELQPILNSEQYERLKHQLQGTRPMVTHPATFKPIAPDQQATVFESYLSEP